MNPTIIRNRHGKIDAVRIQMDDGLLWEGGVQTSWVPSRQLTMPIWSVASRRLEHYNEERILWFDIVGRTIAPLTPPDPSFAEMVLAEMLWNEWLKG